MPKFPTFPTLYDEVLKLNITNLKKWGYLKPQQIMLGFISWSRHGNELAKIAIKIDTSKKPVLMELTYTYKDQPMKYSIKLVSIPSNLGKGVVWYFLCPKTNKRCRLLYLKDGYFSHREGIKNCMYETQTQSKKYRGIDKVYGAYFKSDKLYQQLNQKHFKKTYAGKPTKKYLRIMEILRQAEGISHEDIISLLIS